MNSKSSQRGVKKEKISEAKPSILSIAQSQASYLPPRANKLNGKRSYIQMPLSEKKQMRDSKTKIIQKLHKKSSNRKQKTQELQVAIFDQYHLNSIEQLQQENYIENPLQNNPSIQQNNLICEILNTDERQKSTEMSSLYKNSNPAYKNQQNCSYSNCIERTYSQLSEISDRTLTENQGDCNLGFVIDSEDNEDIVSNSLLSIPNTPKLLQQNIDINNNELDQQQKQDEANKTQISKQQISINKDILSTESYQYLNERLQYYKVCKQTFEIKHPEITAKNRQILIDWLMDVSDKFHLKRQTFQLAINFADRYLMNIKNFELDNYQKLGISCLLMACKIEEIYYPKHIDFQSITDDNCMLEEILYQETDVLVKLNWVVNPPTLNFWTNLYMMKWDQYAEDNPLGLFLLDTNLIHHYNDSILSNSNFIIPKFKSDDNQHYLNYRHVMQVLDIALINLDHYLYDYRHLSAASIVIMIALNYQKLTLQQLVSNIENFTQTPNCKQQQVLDYIYDSIVCQANDEFSHMIINYLENYCDIRVPEIKDALRYIQIFFTVPLQTHMPSKLQGHNTSVTQEEFYSFQVYYNDIELIMDKINKLKQQIFHQ